MVTRRHVPTASRGRGRLCAWELLKAERTSEKKQPRLKKAPNVSARRYHRFVGRVSRSGLFFLPLFLFLFLHSLSLSLRTRGGGDGISNFPPTTHERRDATDLVCRFRSKHDNWLIAIAKTHDDLSTIFFDIIFRRQSPRRCFKQARHFSQFVLLYYTHTEKNNSFSADLRIRKLCVRELSRNSTIPHPSLP